MSSLIKFLVAAVIAGTPLLLGTVGEIICEKAGHLNLGVEGIMSIGACAGFMWGYMYDSFWIALAAAFLGGVLSSLIYAVLTVTFMANQNVTGLTLTIFGVGLSNLIGVYMLGKSPNGTLKLPAGITAATQNIHIKGLSDLPIVGELLFSYNPLSMSPSPLQSWPGYISTRPKSDSRCRLSVKIRQRPMPRAFRLQGLNISILCWAAAFADWAALTAP